MHNDASKSFDIWRGQKLYWYLHTQLSIASLITLTINCPNVAHPTGTCTIITHAVAAKCQVLELSSKWEKAPIYQSFCLRKEGKIQENKSAPNCMQFEGDATFSWLPWVRLHNFKLDQHAGVDPSCIKTMWTLRSWTKTVARAHLPDMASSLVTALPSLLGLG